MISVIEWSKSPSPERRDHWKNKYSEQLCYEYFVAGQNDSELTQNWNSISKKDCAAILVDDWVSNYLLENLKRVSLKTVDWGCIDALMFDRGQWWPDCFLRASLAQMITDRAKELNTLGVAYLTGQGREAQAALSVLSQLGFLRIVLVEKPSDLVRKLVQTWSRRHFGVDLQILDPSFLTLQPGNGSILINTTGLEERESLDSDLTYLNFIKKGGLVVDLASGPGPHPLLEEAQSIKLTTISGAEIRAHADWQLLKKLGVLAEQQCSFAEYLSEYGGKSKIQS